MTTAYRDDLEATRARVRDLEREAERLRKRNAELTSMHAEHLEPREKTEPSAAREPEPSDFAKVMATIAKLCFAIALVALGGPKIQAVPYTPHPGYAAIFAALGFLFWCFSGFPRLWR